MNGNERKPNGQFAEGNPGGPGRPPRDTERDYLATLAEVVDPDAWREICKRALADAKDGDATARRWIGDYLLGKPAQKVDVGTDDDETIRMRFGLELMRLCEEVNTGEPHVIDEAYIKRIAGEHGIEQKQTGDPGTISKSNMPHPVGAWPK